MAEKTSAGTESHRQTWFMQAQATTKMTAISPQNAHVCLVEMTPVTRGRFWVRGLSLSKGRSTRRLNAIAKDRAATMAMVRKTRLHAGGIPRAARNAPAQAYGRANMECSILIIRQISENLPKGEDRRPRCGLIRPRGFWKRIFSPYN